MTQLLERYMIDGLVAGGSEVRVMRPRLEDVPVHWHDFYELGYVVDGSARHMVNGASRGVGPGTVFLLTPTDFHALRTPPGQSVTCYNIVLEPRAAERWLDRALPAGVAGPPWVVDGCTEIAADFDRLWSESQGGRPGAAALTDAILGCILIELARRGTSGAGEQVPRHPADPAVGIRRAVQYVERHFREPLTLAEVAAHAHLSPNYFSERFSQLMGMPFQTYLQTLRLRFARSLLASTTLGVTEVCHAAGFNSPSHFGRAYRRRYGQAPSAGRGPRPDTTVRDAIITA